MTRAGTPMRRLFALLLSFFLTAPAVHAQTTADEERALATVRTFIQANETANLDLIVSTFAEEATAFMPGGDAPYRLTGKPQIRAGFAALFKGRTGPITITPAAVNAQMFGDMAIVTAHLRPIPPTPITERISFARRTFVVRRVSDTWLIVHLHASNFQWDPPGA